MIRKLGRNTINKIAAGEVVERPVSVVKELTENAIDAGAHRIDVMIEGSPLDMISVSDDGFGIPFSEIEKAFERHATSKINNVSDLEVLDTLGFRGEALPSIASVSQCTLISTSRDETHGGRIEINGGKIIRFEEASRKRGTSVTVRNLFYNIPARRKYLKSGSYETRLIRELLENIALIYADSGLAVTFTVNGERKLSVGCDDSFTDRVAVIHGSAVADSLNLFKKEREHYLFQGWISGSDVAAKNSRHMNFYVNGRVIKDKKMIFTVRNALREVFESGTYPYLFLFLNVDPEYADFNVHPRKTEIRLRNEKRIFGSIYNSLQAVFSDYSSLPSGGFERFVEYQGSKSKGTQVSLFENSTPGPEVSINEEEKNQEDLAGHRYQGVLFDRYLVFVSSEEMIFVDFHALNERMVYDKLLEKEYDDPGKHIIPEVVRIGSRFAELVKDKMDDLARIGLHVRSFGDDSVIIESVPAFLKDAGRAEMLLRELCEGAERGNGPFDKYLAERACKASFRTGDHLSEEDIKTFAKALEKGGFSLTCPHGRPVARIVKKENIDTLFKR